MTSIGNDIVALDHGNADRSGQYVFYSKVLTAFEKELYSQERFPGLSFAHFVWLCWSIKEASFKCIKRNQPHLLFSPQKINIKALEPLPEPFLLKDGNCDWDIAAPETAFTGYCGTVGFGDMVVTAISRVYDTFISTIATVDAGSDTLCWGIRRIARTDPAHQSESVRLFVLERLRRSCPEDEIKIEKASAGYPVIVRNAEWTNMPLSFSHHHDLVAFSFLHP
ncbi:MAG TPA: 4'-phosphopantetheinyl transferase superfamily protein [Puia sp.]|nr:4'-phosphopantetheinyl transferase superfamily protein [Puia sp.]